MDRIQQLSYEKDFRIVFLEAKGDEFQRLFEKLMGKAHLNDFMACRPWGNVGDRKNDGYLYSLGSVGPVNAIAQDYKVLELKGVVEVKTGTKKGRTGPMLRLLKTEVGELALQAIRQGDVSEHSLSSLPTAAVTTFSGPEHNREKIRRAQTKMSPKATNDMLSILRTGGGI